MGKQWSENKGNLDCDYNSVLNNTQNSLRLSTKMHVLHIYQEIYDTAFFEN
jgi:hypothetical protein